MAKGRIEKGDIVQEGILKDFNKEILETSKNITTLELSLQAVAETGKKLKKGVSVAKPKDVKTIQEFNALTEKSNANAKNRLEIDKTLLVQKEKLKQAQSAQNKAIKTEVLLGDKQINTLEKLRARNAAIKIAKDKVNFSTKKGQLAIKKLNAELDRNNKVLEKNASKLGKQKIGIGRYSKAVAGLRSGLAQLGLGLGVFSILKSSFNIVKDFEQGQADLASVLGISVDQMGKLTEQAKRLGATTTFTASQVSELQKEYAKLGFTQSEIEGVTEATLLLAEATGTELGRAAEVTGATMRGFGLSADETQRVVDVMAKSFSSSSLDMEKFATAMSAVAPVAKNAGFSIEQTTALIGTLTDRGIDASSAGTGLRNMFLDAKKNGLSFNEALKQINGASDKTAESFKLFGKRGATLGVILAENGASVEDLTGKLLDSDEAAKDMAETQRATLGGAIKLLTSAWEGFILRMNEAGGVGDKLRKVVVFLADNLDTILSILGLVVKVFIAFKVAMKAIELQKFVKGLGGVSGAFKKIKGGAKGATTGMNKLGKAMKGIGFGLAITAGLELLKLLWDLASGTAELRRQEDLLAAAREVSTKSVEKVLEPINKQIDAEKKLLEIQLAKGDLKGGQLEFEEKLKALEDKKLKRLEHERNLRARQVFDLKKANELIEAEKKTRTVNADDFSASESGQNSYANAIDRVNRANAESNRQIQKNLDLIVFKQTAEKAFQTEIDTTSDAIHDYTVNITSNTLEKRKGTGATKDSTDAIELETLAMEIENTTIEESIRKLHELRTAKEDVLTTFEDSERATLTRNVQEAEYNILTADSKISEEEMNKLLEAQILAKAELEKLGKSGIEQQLIDLRAKQEIKDLNKELIETEIDLAKIRREALEFTSDLAVKLIDERIKKLDEETEAHKKQAETLRTLAENGSIEAKESIAEENRLIAENEQKKAEQEKRKQRILLVTSVLQAYNANMESGMESGEALTSAITSKAVLDQFIASIGSAYEGTEDTGTTNNPLDSNGGRVMLIHDNERVMTKKQNAMIG
jgi:hypothetical protein